MPRFQHRPVIVEAHQFLPYWQNPAHWPDGVKQVGSADLQSWVIWNAIQRCYTRVTPGDWIITGSFGERFPWSDEVFRATYEPFQVEG